MYFGFARDGRWSSVGVLECWKTHLWLRGMFDGFARRHMGHAGSAGSQAFGNEKGGLMDLSLLLCQFCVYKVIVYAWHLIWKDEDIS